MKIVMSSGHGKIVRGASGSPVPPYLDEVDEARKVVEASAKALRALGVEIKTYHDDVSKSQNENLNRIVDFHNAQGAHDYDVSVHFNAYQTTSKPMGTEVLYVTQNELAVKVSQAIANAGGFINRGSKHRTDLFFLNQTHAKSILLEVCFVDSSVDADLYRAKFNDICGAIATSISGKTKPVTPTEPATVVHYDNITATMFGGAADNEVSAYDAHYLDDTALYVALPFKFKGERPRVKVWHGEAYGVGTIEDVGPWMIDDAYWENNDRPLVEEYYKAKKPLPRGPNAGKVPSNDAAIDLSPALARMIGLEGKGKVSWEFYTEQDEVA